MYTQNTTQKELRPSAKMVYPRFRIAGPCNSTEKNPQCGKKLNYKQLFVQHIHIYDSSHNRFVNAENSVVKKLNTQASIHPPI